MSFSSIIQQLIPKFLQRWVTASPPTSRFSTSDSDLHFGNLRRLTPVSPYFGYDRGQPVDRYYIENFLARQAKDIQGHVLEVGDDSYTRQFGGERVTASEVINVMVDNPATTIIGDLSHTDHISANTFDCIILTQTLQFIYDVQAVINTIHRILKPGGVVLATFSGISQIAGDTWGEYQYWAFTALSTKRLFEAVFQDDNIKIETFGNLLSAVAFLQGMAAEELDSEELDYNDHKYELIITVRAQKEKIADLENHPGIDK